MWFKVKTGDQRAVVIQLQGDDVPAGPLGSVGAWWMGAAGHRQADSPQHDFYESVRRECTVGRTISTDRLLPTDWDWKRLTAEQAVAWRREMKRLVIRLIATSLASGRLAVAEFRHHRIKALVRADNENEACLAIIAEGIPVPKSSPYSSTAFLAYRQPTGNRSPRRLRKWNLRQARSSGRRCSHPR